MAVCRLAFLAGDALASVDPFVCISIADSIYHKSGLQGVEFSV